MTLLDCPAPPRNPDLSEVTEITVRVNGSRKEFKGRLAWTLANLIRAGDDGITSAQLPAGVRLAHYIFALRMEGINIATERERHGGEFSGTHARYTLKSAVEVIGGVE